MDPEADTRASKPETDPYVGRTFDGYRIEGVIGRGGMGVVYKANQLSLGRPVAIKLLPEDFADRPQFLERFHREVDVLSKLSHPNIVTVFERGEIDERPYLVMEYVEGTSLRDVIKEGPLPAAEALNVVRGVLAALEHAHDKGIIHRDIKPENVLVAPGGIVKVADFGLGRLLGEDINTRLTHTHLMLGTFEYMAPEQREKAKEADERADIYATGVVLYELIAGELPIGAFEPLSAKRPKECDARVDALIQRSLEKSPDKRYQRASEMGGDVSRLLTAAPVQEAPAAPAPEPDGTKDKRKRGAIHVDTGGDIHLEFGMGSDRESRKKYPWLSPVILFGALIVPAYYEFKWGAGPWVIWACCFIIALKVAPLLLDQLKHVGKFVFWILVSLSIPAVLWLFAGSMTTDGGHHKIEVVRVHEDVPDEFGDRMLENAKVQLFMREQLKGKLFYELWAGFPKGITWDEDDGKLAIRIDRDVCHNPDDAQMIASLVAMLMEKTTPEKVTRIVTADPDFEKHIESARENAPTAPEALGD